MVEQEIGKITHYFGHISVGIIELSDSLKVGDTIHIKGHTSDFTQNVESIQIEHVNVSEAKEGDVVGVRVSEKVHPHDKVYRVTE
jgi:putative protease